jgi:hypothetical protein
VAGTRASPPFTELPSRSKALRARHSPCRGSFLLTIPPDANGRNVSLPTLRRRVIAAVATAFAESTCCVLARAMPP